MTTEAPVILQADRRMGETRALRTELRRRGARVLMAETAEQAFQRAEEARPDVLLLDDDVTQNFQGDFLDAFAAKYPDTETILLSSRSQPLTQAVGRGLLFSGRRPVSTQTLLDLMTDALPGRLKEVEKAPEVHPMVLCIDDDAQTLSSLSRLLERHGYRVSTIQDSREVLPAIANLWPDMAIIDVLMPEVNGCELARKIREQYRGMFPIVMHSAKSSDADRWAGFRYGADYYLPKPSEPHQILDVVDYYSDRLDREERQFLEGRL